MNYLEIVQSLASDSGVVPNAGPPGSATAQPSTVSAATGLLLRMTGWINREWRMLQNERDDWKWMRVPFSKGVPTTNPILSTAGMADEPSGSSRWGRYIPLTNDGVSAFSCYKTSIGVSDESPLEYVPYETFLVAYGRGTQPAPTKPSLFTINQNGHVLLYPTQDEGVTVRGLYYRSPQVLSADSDIPEMPPAFHDLIIYRALLAADIFDEARGRVDYWEREARRLHDALVHDQTDAPFMGHANVSSNWMPGYPI